jgi:acetyl-CoA/propionyl-CoA carboxylase biotin carboxyl carrier protein
MPTVLPFHRAVVEHADFTGESSSGFAVHTRWIETDFENTIPPYSGPTAELADGAAGLREAITVEVGGRRLEVVLPDGLGAGLRGTDGARGGQAAGRSGTRRRTPSGSASAASGDSLTSPMQGTIVKVAVEDGRHVNEGELVLVLEAMKMEQPLNAHKAGTVTGLTAEVGATVASGALICEIRD